MSQPDRLTLGTAGHIDHGKTALVAALTGVMTDRLPQEQARGISIELGYARLELPSGRSLSLIDVPGHERFVRTMIAGATGIDLALLVVACDDGVMPQTREHLAILELLDIAELVVALTKRDAVDDDTALLVEAEVEELLGPTRFAGCEVVETSARVTLGIDELRTAIERAADRVVPRHGAGALRLPIDRVFSLHGIGTVVTGTLWSGSLGEGDRVRIEPRGLDARVRSVQVHDTGVPRASAGQRVAASLVGVERAEIARGDVVGEPDTLPVSYRFDATVTVLPGNGALRQSELVDVLIGTAGSEARVALLEGETIDEGASGLVQLRLRRQLIAIRGDRLILRRTAPQHTLAGGVVLDPTPQRHGADGAVLARLRLLARGDVDAVLRAGLTGATYPVTLAELAPRGLLDRDLAERTLTTQSETKRFEGSEPTYLAHERYTALGEEIRSRLQQRAAENPLEPGLPLAALVGRGPGADALAVALESDGVLRRDGALGQLPGPGASPAQAYADEATLLLQLIDAGGYAPEDLPTLGARISLESTTFASLCAALERDGSIVRFGADLAYTAHTFAQARDAITARCAERGEITLAEARDLLGASRRIVQPLLERLDSDGVTRRVGDHRILRRKRVR